ncbi:mitogen-activated protein kinase kinase kinase 21 [Striga hermonthica]|uniref:Mitogen-activated protein kinase kinase kinase 21 n=1 Tax=Striga hermonthica TaxID=68872 RepID=A0A9N7MT76_STRHE|nr:mitogen-activated protein kinase kinase kinase 21 [Striga hermonthica]
MAAVCARAYNDLMNNHSQLMCGGGGSGGEYGGEGVDWIRGPLLGSGSYGRVYKATSLINSSSSLMAVKTSLSQTLAKEFEILVRLYDCPHVIRCLGYHTTQDYEGRSVSNLLLEYASGGSLLDRIKKSGGRLPEMEVSRHTRSILSGLRHIHGLGYVHSDLKLENVLLVAENDDFTAKISDFGLSKERGTVPYARGTREYLSPEAELFGRQEEPSDVWALGCVVLEMLVGLENAWEGTKEEILSRIIGRKMISEDARDFLQRCFTSDPDQRPTADSLLLHSFVDDYAKNLFSSANAISVEDAEYGFSFHFDFDDDN